MAASMQYSSLLHCLHKHSEEHAKIAYRLSVRLVILSLTYRTQFLTFFNEVWYTDVSRSKDEKGVEKSLHEL